jgi:hypothetical protein
MPEGKLGALWERTGKKGRYLTGVIEIEGETIPIVCFGNPKYQEGTSQPRFYIMKSDPSKRAGGRKNE